MNRSRGAAAAPRSLRIVGASAGSGKTTRLTREVTSAVDPESPAPVRVEGLVAVTYTRRAHAELSARIRRTLVRAGAFDRAQRLPLAYVGTVHAVCLRLLQEFAIDAGLSPEIDVLPGEEGRLLREALEGALAPVDRERMTDLASRLQIRWDARVRRHDWITPIDDIMTLARSNRIAPERLPEMGRRSMEGLEALLPPPEADGEALDAALAQALDAAIEGAARVDDGQKNTADAVATMRELQRKLGREGLAWADWARLARIAPGKAAKASVAPLAAAAGRYERHPRLRAEVRAFTEGAFEAARVGLTAYADWKARRRTVDYVDMIDRALTLVEDPAVARELGERLDLAVVDEFQDTSPLQLELFVRLHRLAGRSTWVGDRKQCIFEYAGADPALMEEVTKWVRGGRGAEHDSPLGEEEHLSVNYRSRPELVEACSGLFVSAFERHGFAAAEVAVSPHRSSPPRLAELPAVGLWWLSASSADEEAGAVAEGVRRLLSDPDATPIVDRDGGEVRGLRPGDVAILVYTNAEAEALAGALHARGIHSALARPGLLATPEGTAVDAALRVLLDERDTLSQAILEALHGHGGEDPDAWLDARIAAESERRAAAERRAAGTPGSGAVSRGGGEAREAERAPASSWQGRIEALRPRLDVLSPREAVDGVLAALDAAVPCARWPDPAQRLANLDALRGLALDYEERCARQREAATLAGLLRYFDEMREPVRRRDEERASDEQHVAPGEHAVTISTFHRSKGLEWPVVVLGSLNRKEKRDAFDVCPESDREGFDPADPLGGRWVRYWPWPLGQQQKVPLADAARASPEGRRVADREDKERVRLLYVGFTRARDHLVLAGRLGKKGPSVAWLDELETAGGEPVLEYPTGPEAGAASEAAPALLIRGLGGSVLRVHARVWHLAATGVASERLGVADEHRWFSRPVGEGASRPRHWIAPSRARDEWPGVPRLAVGRIERLGAPMAFESSESRAALDWEVVGTTIHAFLGADVPELTKGERLEGARRLLEGASLLSAFRPEALLERSDALRAFVDARWPGATWRREVPISAFVDTAHGTRRVGGAIDLLLETREGFVVIDHKSFPGAAEGAFRAKAVEYAPQLACYAEALRRIPGARVLGCWVHFTLAGAAVELAGGGEDASSRG